MKKTIQLALDLINRQQAEIERYKGVIKLLENDVKEAQTELKEFKALYVSTVAEMGIKAFAERLKAEDADFDELHEEIRHDNLILAIENLVKEMTESVNYGSSKSDERKGESMLDLENQKARFKDHISTFTDYGNIKILDFKKPDSTEYRIRFMFEEDFCRLHITGDLGDLIASNYNNMTYDKFSDFVNNAGYFEEKIDCMSKKVYFYDRDKAVTDLKELIEEHQIADELMENTFNDSIEQAIDEVLENFDIDRGISEKGYEIMDKCICDFWEEARYLGRDRTGIIELYLLAFKLATQQLQQSQ